jgi:hypothetical protein
METNNSFEKNRESELSEFLRYSEIVDAVIGRWDREDAVAYWGLLQEKDPPSYQSVSTCFLNLIDPEAEIWDNDVFPPRLMFLAALMLVRWAVYKSGEEECEEYPQWAAALRWSALFVEGKH